VFYTQRGVKVFVESCRAADDLMGGVAVDGAHRQEEGFPGAVIGEIDGDDDCDANADAEKREYELPGMSPQIGKAGAIQGWHIEG